MRRGRRSCFLVFTRSQAKNRRTEHDFLSGRSWRCGGFFVVGRWCFIMAPGTRRTVSGPGYWWIPETVPLSSRKNAKGGGPRTQLATCVAQTSVPGPPTHFPASQEETSSLHPGASVPGGAVYWRDEGRKRKGVEGEMGLAKARRCAGPFGRRGIARLLM